MNAKDKLRKISGRGFMRKPKDERAMMVRELLEDDDVRNLMGKARYLGNMPCSSMKKAMMALAICDDGHLSIRRNPMAKEASSAFVFSDDEDGTCYAFMIGMKDGKDLKADEMIRHFHDILTYCDYEWMASFKISRSMPDDDESSTRFDFIISAKSYMAMIRIFEIRAMINRISYGEYGLLVFSVYVNDADEYERLLNCRWIPDKYKALAIVNSRNFRFLNMRLLMKSLNIMMRVGDDDFHGDFTKEDYAFRLDIGKDNIRDDAVKLYLEAL